MKAEIIAVGTELLLGQIVDTNSAHMAQQLTTIGLDLHYKSTVGDNLKRIKSTLRNAMGRSDFIITTGGIGPTLDDLTREAVAEVLGRPLVFNPTLFDQISDFFTRMGRTASPNNRKQAFIPEGAIPIENPVGTAPGFIAEQDGKAIIIVPGVPHEMRYFMEHSVLPYLRNKLGIREVIVSRVLKLFGIGESLVDERLKDLIEQGTNPTIGLLAHTQIGEIHVRLTAKETERSRAESLNASLEAKIRERLQEFIFGVDEESYADAVVDRRHEADRFYGLHKPFWLFWIYQLFDDVQKCGCLAEHFVNLFFFKFDEVVIIALLPAVKGNSIRFSVLRGDETLLDEFPVEISAKLTMRSGCEAVRKGKGAHGIKHGVVNSVHGAKHLSCLKKSPGLR
ncbi:MAG: CinA family nicotinamide mononucleotide deamidase-related protein [Thermodesulfobacteriota bacterium]